MKIKNVKLTCPECGNEMELLEVEWTGLFVFECQKCETHTELVFYKKGNKCYCKDYQECAVKSDRNARK